MKGYVFQQNSSPVAEACVPGGKSVFTPLRVLGGASVSRGVGQCDMGR